MKNSFTIVCDTGCGSPVAASLDMRNVEGKMRQVLVCMGCGAIQSKETMKKVLSPNYKEPVLISWCGWIFPEDDDYELWKNLMKHDCSKGEFLIQLDKGFDGFWNRFIEQ
ncbi:MAG: hypothetical protein KGI27_13610 [Thaumarchaeota archaeon]|nr:hypothetical protein [Nitrososphaerota archaeon]